MLGGVALYDIHYNINHAKNMLACIKVVAKVARASSTSTRLKHTRILTKGVTL